jgi:hypothetical protein
MTAFQSTDDLFILKQALDKLAINIQEQFNLVTSLRDACDRLGAKVEAKYNFTDKGASLIEIALHHYTRKNDTFSKLTYDIYIKNISGTLLSKKQVDVVCSFIFKTFAEVKLEIDFSLTDIYEQAFTERMLIDKIVAISTGGKLEGPSVKPVIKGKKKKK